MGVVETRCSAFENEFKHTEAHVTEVSGSVNFGDKFHEVHLGWAYACVCTYAYSKRVSHCNADREATKQVRMGITVSVRCVRFDVAID